MDDLFSTQEPDPAGSATHRIRVGIGGWQFAPWRRNFYPDGLVQRRELEYASRQLTAIEINGTYHSPQKPTIYAKWRDETPEGFVFSAKAPKYIMQARQLGRMQPQIEDFIGGIAELGSRLGPLVWQFDQGRRLELAMLDEFLALLPRRHGERPLRHVLEIRDPAIAHAALVGLARKHHVATVFTDSAEHPSFADISADFVYARLMRSRPLETGYPPDELRQWARLARQWQQGEDPASLPHLAPPLQETKPRDVFVYFIGSTKDRNPAAAMALIRLLEK